MQGEFIVSVVFVKGQSMVNLIPSNIHDFRHFHLYHIHALLIFIFDEFLALAANCFYKKQQIQALSCISHVWQLSILSPAPRNLYCVISSVFVRLLQREEVCIIMRHWSVVASVKIHGTNIY